MEPKEYLLIAGICLCCFFGIPVRIKKNSDGQTEEQLFKEYIKNFNKSYTENDSVYLIRFENFKVGVDYDYITILYEFELKEFNFIENCFEVANSLRLIEDLNRNRSSNQSALYGLTIFSDLSQDEFAKHRLQKVSKHLHEKYPRCNNMTYKEFHHRMKRSEVLPKKVDWREKGVIGVVHNQKTCGACWAFSTIETAESMNAMKIGSLVELSVQEVIDCARFGNYGCDGGDSCSLLNWLVATKTKITTWKLYPFVYKTGICRVKKPKTGVQIQNFSCNNFIGAEHLLQKKLAFHGPVAAAVNAINWQYYVGGIIQYHCTGAQEDLNHAVQIVGYDKTGPVPFYIARNSWGTEFGDKGYVYIAIGGNLCGLANEVTSLDVL